MSFDLASVLTLGELDQKMIEIRKRLADATHQAAPQRQRVKAAQAELERLTDQAKHTNRDVKRLEGEAEAKKEAMAKAEVSLNTAKSNDEYQSLLKTIETHKAALSELETQILETYELQEQHAAERVAAEKRLTSQQGELKAAEQRVAEAEGALRKQLDELEAQRGEAAGQVSSDISELYQRVLEKVGDTAVARVTDEMCQGCFTKVRPNQLSQILGGKELVTCWTCGRILYGISSSSDDD